MKQQLLFVGALALLLVAEQSLWAQPEGLVGYWPLDEGSGTVAFDMSGNGNDGVFNGDPQWVPGKIGGGLELDGDGDFLDCGNNGTLNLTDGITVAIWVKIPLFDTTWQAIVTNGDSSWRVHRSSGSSNIAWGTSSLSSPADLHGTTAVDDDQWHHIAAVYDGTQKVLYIDGEVDAQSDETGSIGAGASHNINIGENNQAQGRHLIGVIDDVQIYNRGLSQEEVQKIMKGLTPPELARAVNPLNEDIDIPHDLALEWAPGEFAATHDVYLGTIFNDVNDATVGSPLMVGQGLTDTGLDVGRLEFGQTYFWRVDEVNSAPDRTVFKGEVWSFMIEPHGRPITAITATASSSNANNMGPEKTVDGSGLNELDQHGTTATDMWLSGMGDPTPSIQYEFDKAYKLHQMLVWNSNQLIESFIGLGAKDVVAAYSLDGAEWTALEGATQFNQAPGNDTYEANTIIDFAGTLAQYVKITITGGYGMLPQYGLSEVRILYIPTFAMEPQPADGATVDSANVQLSWRAGREADTHEFYLGTDPADLPLVATTTEASYLAEGLDFSATYYWSVTEVNENEAVTAFAGDVVSFTTPDYATVDDFDQYDDACNRIFFAWADGLGHSGGEGIDNCDVPASNGNGGGSIVGNDQPPFAERTIVKPGSLQSMPFNYDNSFGDSYATLTLDGQDWTASGIQTLAIAFNGTEGNTGTLYVKINNTKIVYDGNPADIARAAWQAWNIDLTGVSGLQNVTSLAIGVDGGNAAGMLYFDNIRLYAQAGEMLVPVQPDNTGLRAHYTFDEGAGTTVGDSSGNGNNGTVLGAPQWVAGKIGGAMLFGGFDNYVDCGNDASLVIQDAITVTAWIKVDAFASTWETILGMGDDSYRMSRSNGNDDSIHFGANGTGGNLDASTIVTTNTWRHVALVYDGVNKYVYIDGFEDARAPSSGQINASAHNLYIGENSQATGRFLNGAVDDVRIYARALSPEEVAGLAGLTDPVHKSF